jgi:hypothetical protein
MFRLILSRWMKKRKNIGEYSGKEKRDSLVKKILHEMDGNVLKTFENAQKERIASAITDITLSQTPKYHGEMRERNWTEPVFLYLGTLRL